MPIIGYYIGKLNLCTNIIEIKYILSRHNCQNVKLVIIFPRIWLLLRKKRRKPWENWWNSKVTYSHAMLTISSSHLTSQLLGISQLLKRVLCMKSRRGILSYNYLASMTKASTDRQGETIKTREGYGRRHSTNRRECVEKSVKKFVPSISHNKNSCVCIFMTCHSTFIWLKRIFL